MTSWETQHRHLQSQVNGHYQDVLLWNRRLKERPSSTLKAAVEQAEAAYSKAQKALINHHTAK